MWKFVGTCVVTILFSLIIKADALVGYNCLSPINEVTTYSTTAVEECKHPSIKTKNITLVEVQILQKSKFLPVDVFQCLLEIDQKITYCGMHSHTSEVYQSHLHFTHQLTKSQCQDLIATNRFIYPYKHDMILTVTPYVKNSSPIYVVGSASVDGSCEGGSYNFRGHHYKSVVVYHQFTLKYGQVMGKYEINTANLLINGLTCQYDTGLCEDAFTGFNYWHVNKEITCDPNLYVPVYTGFANTTILTDSATQTSYKVLTIREEMYVFSLRYFGTVATCFEQFQLTDHHDLFLVFKSNSNTFRKPGLQNTTTENMSLLNYINTKFVFLQQHLATQIENLYHDLLWQACCHKRTTLMLMLTIAFTNPEQFSFLMTNQPGYTAMTAGEFVHLIKCQPLNVTYRPDDRCYLELPVSYNNESYFLTPRNRLLVRHGTEIPCNPMFPIAYNLSHIWTETTRQPHFVHPPLKLDPNFEQSWTFDYVVNLGQAGLFTQTQIEQLTRQMLLPVERQNIGNVLINQVYNPGFATQGITFSNLLTEDHLHNSITSYSAKFTNGLQTFGSYVSSIIGIVFLVKLVITTIDTFFNAYHLFQIFGWSVKLFAAIFHSVTTYFLFLFNNPTPQDPDSKPDVVPTPTVPATVPAATDMELTPKLYPVFN